MLEEKNFPLKLKKAVEEWVTYKREKRQNYKPTGFKNLLAQVESKANKYGVDKVVDVMQFSMGQNWQGIAWGKLDENKKSFGYNSGKSGSGEYIITKEEEEAGV